MPGHKKSPTFLLALLFGGWEKLTIIVKALLDAATFEDCPDLHFEFLRLPQLYRWLVSLPNLLHSHAGFVTITMPRWHLKLSLWVFAITKFVGIGHLSYLLPWLFHLSPSINYIYLIQFVSVTHTPFRVIKLKRQAIHLRHTIEKGPSNVVDLKKRLSTRKPSEPHLCWSELILGAFAHILSDHTT